MRKSGQFRTVFEQGRHVADRRMAIHYRPNGSDVTRIGIAVGRRIGTAVVRNRLKRRLRVIARELPERLQRGFDLVLLARRSLVDATLDDIRKAATALMKKIP